MVGCRLLGGVAITPNQDVVSNCLYPPPNLLDFHHFFSEILPGATLMPKGILFHFILPRGGVEGCWKCTVYMPEGTLDISQSKYFGITNFSKQIINSWNWIFSALQGSVQWSAVYTAYRLYSIQHMLSI